MTFKVSSPTSNICHDTALGTPLAMIDLDVLADDRPVSFRLDRAQGDVRVFLSMFLDSLGYSVTDRSGVAYIASWHVEGRLSACVGRICR